MAKASIASCLSLVRAGACRRSRSRQSAELNSMSTKSQHPETVVLHAGYRHDAATRAVAVPIYQTTSYQFAHTEHAANLFALKELGNIYTRIMNTTTALLDAPAAGLA